MVVFFPMFAKDCASQNHKGNYSFIYMDLQARGLASSVLFSALCVPGFGVWECGSCKFENFNLSYGALRKLPPR
jgi:hypothetical protein